MVISPIFYPFLLGTGLICVIFPPRDFANPGRMPFGFLLEVLWMPDSVIHRQCSSDFPLHQSNLAAAVGVLYVLHRVFLSCLSRILTKKKSVEIFNQTIAGRMGCTSRREGRRRSLRALNLEIFCSFCPRSGDVIHRWAHLISETSRLCFR